MKLESHTINITLGLAVIVGCIVLITFLTGMY